MKREQDMTMKNESSRSVGVQYATGEGWTNSSGRNKEVGPMWKRCPVVDVSGGEIKVQR